MRRIRHKHHSDDHTARGVATLAAVRPDAASLAMQHRLWMRLEGMRQAARRADDHTFLADGRENVEDTGRALEALLHEHEPIDGSALCPGCSRGQCRAAWPCTVVQRIAHELGLTW